AINTSPYIAMLPWVCPSPSQQPPGRTSEVRWRWSGKWAVNPCPSLREVGQLAVKMVNRASKWVNENLGSLARMGQRCAGATGLQSGIVVQFACSRDHLTDCISWEAASGFALSPLRERVVCERSRANRVRRAIGFVGLFPSPGSVRVRGPRHPLPHGEREN